MNALDKEIICPHCGKSIGKMHITVGGGGGGPVTVESGKIKGEVIERFGGGGGGQSFVPKPARGDNGKP